MECKVTDLDSNDFTKIRGSNEKYLLHLHYLFNDDPVHGKLIDENFQPVQLPDGSDKSQNDTLLMLTGPLAGGQSLEIFFHKDLEGLQITQ